MFWKKLIGAEPRRRRGALDPKVLGDLDGRLEAKAFHMLAYENDIDGAALITSARSAIRELRAGLL